ncbi:hypothetical protein BBJ28_00010488 [Nothophytophthora sp. Chile5]|nr:hypothetical protein BBJ28_00010488 [Nothophytophthora sp. Chile5]
MYASSRQRSSSRAGPTGSGGPARAHARRHLSSQSARRAAAAASDSDDEFLSASELVRSLQPVPQPPQARPPYSGGGGRPAGFSERLAPDGPPRQQQSRRRPADAWLPLDATQANLGFNEWPFDAAAAEDVAGRHPKTLRSRGSGAGREREDAFESEPMAPNADDYEAARVRAYQVMYEQQRQAQLHSQTARMQRYQYQRAMQREFAPPPPQQQAQQQQQFRGRGVHPFDPPRRIPRTLTSPASAAAATSSATSASALASFALRPNGMRRDGRFASSMSPHGGSPVDTAALDPTRVDMYASEMDSLPPSSRRPRAPQQVQGRRVARGGHEEDAHVDARRLALASSRPRKQHGDGRSQAEDARASFSEQLQPSFPSQEDAGGHPAAARRAADASDDMDDLPLSSSVPSGRRRPAPATAKGKRPRTKTAAAAEPKAKADGGEKAAEPETPPEPKRRCGRKSMNYSSEQKRERNRAAVKKCRQRQALKFEYLQHKAEALAAENQALSEMLVKNTELAAGERLSLTRGIQMDILLKIKEIFTQSLPKDFVLDADAIWDLNSVLAVSMPSRCYYGIESIKDFWRTSLRMRNKGKIRSFWAWLFRLPPGDRFAEFEIQPFSPSSNLYFITWTTKSTPPLAGSMVIMFGNGHRVTLHVECFGWLIWRYLLSNEPFPEPPLD